MKNGRVEGRSIYVRNEFRDERRHVQTEVALSTEWEYGNMKWQQSMEDLESFVVSL